MSPSSALPRVKRPHDGESPFASTWREIVGCRLAPLPLLVDPGSDDEAVRAGKKPAVGSFTQWRAIPRFPDLEKWERRFPGTNIGIVTGTLSRITVIDIDDPTIVHEIIDRFGRTPILVNTPSGGTHLYYRSNGERCGSLRNEGLAVDIKGEGGLVVAPPSRCPDGRSYKFREGQWSAVADLPFIKTSAIPLVELGNEGGSIRQGQRNDALLQHLLRQAPSCDCQDDLTDIGNTFNENCLPALSEGEVSRTVASAWKMQTEGSNWVGSQGHVSVSRCQLQVLKYDASALLLYMVLRERHLGQRKQFMVAARAMAANDVVPGWGVKKYRAATNCLVDKGLLILVYKGGKGEGDASRYAFSSRVP